VAGGADEPAAFPISFTASVDSGTFQQRLKHHDPIPDAVTVALMVARTGPEGMTLDELRRKTGLAFDVLDRMLAKLTAAGQLFLSKVDGRMVYRAGI
jgi:hypothetical protein